MGLFDDLKKQAAKAADNVAKQAAKTAANAAKQAAKTAGAVTKETVKQAGNIVKDTVSKQAGEKTDQSLDQNDKGNAGGFRNSNTMLRTEDAIRIFYYLMAADGKIVPEEMDKFQEIGKDMDPSFAEHQDALIQECQDCLDQARDDEEWYDILRERVAGAVQTSQEAGNGTIYGSIFLWNLITIAFAEGDYSTREEKLIRSVARLMNIDPSVTKDMEASIRTLTAIENEEQWLKRSGRSYGEVEMHLKELEERKAVIMQSVQALLLD